MSIIIIIIMYYAKGSEINNIVKTEALKQNQDLPIYNKTSILHK